MDPILSKRENQRKHIYEFWKWFESRAEALKSLHENRQFDLLGQEVSREIDKIEPQLAWEIGPGKDKPYLLTISPEGNSKLQNIAVLMIELAPNLEGWELYSSRPARAPAGVIRLPESGEDFATAEWEFMPVEQPERGRLDLVVVDGRLALSERVPALRAVSLYLDQLLGEDTVEAWIGEFRIESPIAVQGKKTFKMAELPDYLLWVTSRKVNPLKRSRHREH